MRSPSRLIQLKPVFCPAFWRLCVVLLGHARCRVPSMDEYVCTSRPHSCTCCSIDMVLAGAEGVVENGGVINKLGTYQIAVCARAHNKPVYIAAESYKVCC